ncbi:uncharacterized protein FFMR_14295 [Fusarium fujikuroi]|nr:uncharacterized protein FFMR_14295 [Fusarium fujikuroi]
MQTFSEIPYKYFSAV